MNKEQALQTIEGALNIATKNGAFDLNQAQSILVAIAVIKNDGPLVPEEKKEVPMKDDKHI